MTAPALFTLGALAGLLAAERAGFRPGVIAAKPLASAGFVATALAAGAAGSAYGRALLAALALCWLGDVLLLRSGAGRAFRLGLAAFLAGHLAFAVAFALPGLEPGRAALAAALCLSAGGLGFAWLRPHLPAGLRLPVLGYLVVISVMVAAALASAALPREPRIAVGALAFYVSDLAVARQRFVARSFANKAWGLPLYYGAQLLLASSA